MKNYKTPELEIVKFASESIMTASGNSYDEDHVTAYDEGASSTITTTTNSNSIETFIANDPIKKIIG